MWDPPKGDNFRGLSPSANPPVPNDNDAHLGQITAVKDCRHLNWSDAFPAAAMPRHDSRSFNSLQSKIVDASLALSSGQLIFPAFTGVLGPQSAFPYYAATFPINGRSAGKFCVREQSWPALPAKSGGNPEVTRANTLHDRAGNLRRRTASSSDLFAACLKMRATRLVKEKRDTHLSVGSIGPGAVRDFGLRHHRTSPTSSPCTAGCAHIRPLVTAIRWRVSACVGGA